MNLQLAGRTALVTGASMGIGRAIAKGLAAEGVALCVAARRRDLLEALREEIVGAGNRAPHIVEADLLPENAPQRLADAAREALGHIDILVNSAGGSRPAVAIAIEKRIHAQLGIGPDPELAELHALARQRLDVSDLGV